MIRSGEGGLDEQGNECAFRIMGSRDVVGERATEITSSETTKNHNAFTKRERRILTTKPQPHSTSSLVLDVVEM